MFAEWISQQDKVLAILYHLRLILYSDIFISNSDEMRAAGALVSANLSPDFEKPMLSIRIANLCGHFSKFRVRCGGP